MNINSALVIVYFQSEAQKQLEEIKSLREKMKEVAEEARGKEDLYKQLVMFGQLISSSSLWDTLADCIKFIAQTKAITTFFNTANTKMSHNQK